MDADADPRRARPRRTQGNAGRLEVFDFATLRAEPIIDKVDAFAIADDHVTIVYREGKRLRAISAFRSRDVRQTPDASSDAPSRKSGWIDLGRIRVSVDPRSEWRQMLHEVWRLQRDQFWVPDMSGVDWNAIYRRYEPLLARVSTRGELSDLIWEMQGELGTSHAYEMGGDHRRPPSIALGYLGADVELAPDGTSYAITRIVRGDAWDAAADSPLNAVGVEAKVGERILAINGQPVSRERPPQALLVHQAGTKVELDAGAGQRQRRDPHRARHHARRRSAGALPRVGRGQQRLGARDVGTDASVISTSPT